MSPSILRLTLTASILSLAAVTASAVPVPAARSAMITDRGSFIPIRKHVPLPGKIIGILASGVQPALGLEGRSGPPDQLCLGYNGGSYRWIYVPQKENPLIGSLNIVVGDKGERKRFDNLSMATAQTVAQWDVKGNYALVEIEVNGGLGSPAVDAFVATRMRQLDGTKEFPFKLDDVIEDLRKKYDQQFKDQARQVDIAMEQAASAALKDRKATGPRDRVEVIYVTWMPEAERLRVHFRTTIMDGDYKYDGGIKVDFGARTMAMRPIATAKVAMDPALSNGLRFGKQFGIEFGTAYELSKTGKVERVLSLPIESFQRELPSPQLFKGAGGIERMTPRTSIRR